MTEREGNYSLQSRVEVKKEWCFISTSPYAIMAPCLELSLCVIRYVARRRTLIS
jgi:hypothetical protein